MNKKELIGALIIVITLVSEFYLVFSLDPSLLEKTYFVVLLIFIAGFIDGFILHENYKGSLKNLLVVGEAILIIIFVSMLVAFQDFSQSVQSTSGADGLGLLIFIMLLLALMIAGIIGFGVLIVLMIIPGLMGIKLREALFDK